jgi:hypothetical protein
MKILFKSDFQTGPRLSAYPEAIIKAEPMLFSASRDWAEAQGGPITKEFLSKLPKHCECLIDSRVHMLMPGWYPCIPGWHLDDVPRTRPDGQPDHAHPAYTSWNVMAIIGDASVTEFIRGDLELEDVGFHEGAVYGKWNAEINKRLAQRDCTISIRRVPSETLISFNFGAFHRGVPAIKNGWRFFIRANFNTARKAMNEIRKQTQVYLPVPEAGW